MEEKLVKILNEMAEYLNISQMKKLQEVLLKNMQEQEEPISETTNYDYLNMFIAAKKIEGCSDRTVSYYKSTVEHLLKCIDTPIRKITTDEIRCYLAKYQETVDAVKLPLIISDEIFPVSFPGLRKKIIFLRVQ